MPLETKNNDGNDVTYCEQCKGYTVIFDMVSSEYVCSSCGCVANDRFFNSENSTGYLSQSGFSDRSRTGLPESLAIHHKGLSTLIGLGDTDARGKALEPAQRMKMQRLRTWNNRSQLNDSISRNLEKALKFLNNFGDKLYLSQAVMESAAYIYRKAAIKKLAKGRSTLGLVGAALYAACRETATPKTISDVATVCNLSSKDVMAHYKLILRELSLQMPVLHGPDYVTLISNRLDLSEKTKREALKIFSEVQQNRISIGKNPRALAGAVIYLASQTCNEFLRQVEICQVADISTVSLRKRCKEIKSNLEI
ncbi:transcription initiation factor IIB [Nitrososphaera sp. AFS]|jgi:transcription initiation factor TFIIB|uniref:transcription initiation factor IIB n=1 Tax=Nitrososphaera sp. AFS TaxID=2301191 RepID=UPI0013923C8B|nr:transcription initiation factor IIB [Nitrososphaera sp. AFS]